MNFWNSITVTEIASIYTVVSKESDRPEHIVNRQSYGISFCKGKGKTTYFINQKGFVSDYTHAILLPMGKEYTLRRQEDGEFPLINFYCKEKLDINEFVLCKLRNPDSYIKDYERILTLWILQKDNAKLLSIFYDILYRLSKEDEVNTTPLIEPAVKYLVENLTDPNLSNEQIAKYANLSEAHFRRLFKEKYSTTPKQFILENRIKQAKLLLSENTYTITSISESCGFSNVYHFCRAFKAITGQTPSEFAKKNPL